MVAWIISHMPKGIILCNQLSAMFPKDKRRSAPLVWTPEADEAWDDLRLLLQSPYVLKLPDLTKPFVLQVDSSRIGVGAILMQEENGVLHPAWSVGRRVGRTCGRKMHHPVSWS
jgi:hypothetical protein